MKLVPLKVLKKTPSINASWQAHAEAHGITSRSPNYNVLVGKFVSEQFPGIFESESEFLKAKALMNYLEAHKLVNSVTHFIGDVCDFKAKGFTNKSVIMSLRCYLTALHGLTSAVEEKDLCALVVEGVKFLAPHCK